VTATVLSNENPETIAARDAFYEARINPSGTPEPIDAEVVEVVESEKPAADAKVEGEGGEQPQAPKNPESKVHVRFSELTERAKAAEAKAAEAATTLEAERKARVLAEQAAADLRAKHEPPKDPLGPKPTRAQFDNDEEFALALEDHTAERVSREIEEKGRRQGLQRQWETREAIAKAAIPDYDSIIANAAELMLPNPVIDAISASEQGPWIAVHLAQNPDLVGKIRDMKPEARMQFIGKLEGKFEAQNTSSAPAAGSKLAAKPVVAAASEISRAPAPISPLKGGSAVPDSPIDAKGEFHGTYAEYKAARKAGKI
jgi:hypothetical protein